MAPDGRTGGRTEGRTDMDKPIIPSPSAGDKKDQGT